MVTLSIQKIEKQLGFKLKRNCYCLGIDVASNTGFSIIEINEKNLTINTEKVKFASISKATDKRAERYEEIIGETLLWIRKFKKKVYTKHKQTILVLENSYLGFNAYTFGFLKFLCGLFYAELYDLFTEIKIIFAISARKEIGFKSALKKGAKRKDKKQEIIDWLNAKIGMEIESDDIADSLILAIVGAKR